MMLRDRAYYQKGLEESGVPDTLWDGLLSYILDHRPTGSFLEAVINNDLRDACARADQVNRYHLWNIVDFLYNYAPTGCWGHDHATTQWLKERIHGVQTDQG